MSLDGLTPGETYYYALKSRDEAHNWSALSNVGRAIMTTPTLFDGRVEPDSGDVDTEFTFLVNYRDPEGDSAAVSNVLIDGIAHPMARTAMR